MSCWQSRVWSTTKKDFEMAPLVHQVTELILEHMNQESMGRTWMVLHSEKTKPPYKIGSDKYDAYMKQKENTVGQEGKR